MNERVSKALGERFSFTIKNTTGATVIVALLAAFFNTIKLTLAEGAPNTATIQYCDATAINAAGYTCNHVLDDGTIVSGLVASSGNSKMSIRQFREYIKMQGRVLVDMSVQANNAAAFNSVIEVVKCSPLTGAAPQYLPLNDFKSVDQSATDKINVNALGLEMTYDTLMLLPIQEGHEITIAFKFS